MKRLILVLFVFSFFTSIQSQNSLELVDQGKMWSYFEHSAGGPPGYNVTFYHKFEGDTVIDQFYYYKVWEATDELYQNWYPYGYIRSDWEGSVYYLDNLFNGGLIYKFNVVPGDTFEIHNGNFIFTAQVVSVDSVQIFPLNETRKRITITNYDDPYSNEEWIEGIGSMAGVLNSGFKAIMLTGAYYDILCQWEDEIEIFSNSQYSFCYQTTVSTPEYSLDETAFKIFPMPLEYESMIKVNEAITKGKIQIFDIFGKLVFESAIVNNKVLTLNKRDFASRIYVVVLYDGEKIIAKRKLIVL